MLAVFFATLSAIDQSIISRQPATLSPSRHLGHHSLTSITLRAADTASTERLHHEHPPRSLEWRLAVLKPVRGNQHLVIGSWPRLCKPTEAQVLSSTKFCDREMCREGYARRQGYCRCPCMPSHGIRAIAATPNRMRVVKPIWNLTVYNEAV